MSGVLGLAAILIAAIAVLFASTAPDGIERLGMETGFASRVRALTWTPLSGYELTFLHSGWASKAGAGLAGLALIYIACRMLAAIVMRRKRSA